MRIKLLRRLVKEYCKQRIPILAWSQDLIQLVEGMTVCVTSSPIFACHSPKKQPSSKYDWSTEGRGAILIQLTDDDDLVAAMKTLVAGGKCLFINDNVW